jgi:hypothetical protein
MSSISKLANFVLILSAANMVYAEDVNNVTDLAVKALGDANINQASLSHTAASDLIKTTESLKSQSADKQFILPPLVQVGEADLDVLWFDVYLAKLYSVDGTYQPQQFPIKLAIQYHRDISAAELIEATTEQWQANGLTESEINRIKKHLTLSWPDVKKNDTLSFIIHNDKQAEFLFNDKPFYQLEDAEFSAAFIGIWLSETTTEPDLRQQLIGATQ